MRDRLIELINQKQEAGWRFIGDGYTTDVFNFELADYLLANGVIVPPCKVGDTVYAFSDTMGTVLEYFVENLTIAYLEENQNCYTYEANCVKECVLLDSIDFDFDDIGKTVFLTREEAEQALKGGEQE